MKTKLKLSENNFPQPKKVSCFQCQTEFYIKYIVPRFTYSKKNDWYHWTDKQENQGKYICDSCLWKFYYHRKVYWETISDLKKRVKLTAYIHKGIIANE